jgi:hypothetical protein
MNLEAILIDTPYRTIPTSQQKNHTQNYFRYFFGILHAIVEEKVGSFFLMIFLLCAFSSEIHQILMMVSRIL